MADPRDDFNRFAGSLDYPMLIVTTRAEDERSGCLVGFHTQGSIHPPHYLVCLSDKNHTYRVARRAPALAVHVVPAPAKHLAELFGSETDDQVDKFAHCRWREGPEGLPILEECGHWFAGRILESHPLGDHVGFLLEPFAASSDPAGGFLTFQMVKQMSPGHEA